MTQFTRFVPISKIDKDKRLVTGYASTPRLDSDDEIVELSAIKAALPDYLEWGNVRQMHQAVAVGVAKEATIDDKGLLFTAKVVDDNAWKLVDEGVLKGFSIGGNVISKVGNRIKELQLLEISLVDRPANPDCRFEMVKGAKVLSESPVVLQHNVEDPLSKGETTFLRRLISFFKGEHPLNADWNPLSAVTDAPVANEGGGSAHSPFRPHLWYMHLEPLEAGADIKPYGDVEYADPGHRDDKKHRYPVDTEEHIRSAWSYINMPKNQEPYSAEQVASIKAKIEAAWKAKIDSKGPPSAEADKSATGAIQKDMGDVADLSYAFETLRRVQRNLLEESALENDDPKDKEFADRAKDIAVQLATLMADISGHEGNEAEDLTGAEDNLFRQWTGASLEMSANTTVNKRFSAAFKEHMGKCVDHMGKAVACHKEAMEGIRALREMHQQAAMKAAKGITADVIDHAAAMEHVHKCMGAMTKMEDHHELAAHHLEKCYKAAGHTDVDTTSMGDGSSVMAPEYSAPGFDGIKPHASPLGQGAEGAEGIYAPKGANAELVKAIQEAAYYKGQAEALSRMPGTTFRAKTFDFGGAGLTAGGGAADDKTTTLFKGVNTAPQDQAEAVTAAGKAIGNMLSNPEKFAANPMFDPNFKGAAAR